MDHLELEWREWVRVSEDEFYEGMKPYWIRAVGTTVDGVLYYCSPDFVIRGRAVLRGWEGYTFWIYYLPVP